MFARMYGPPIGILLAAFAIAYLLSSISGTTFVLKVENGEAALWTFSNFDNGIHEITKTDSLILPEGHVNLGISYKQVCRQIPSINNAENNFSAENIVLEKSAIFLWTPWGWRVFIPKDNATLFLYKSKCPDGIPTLSGNIELIPQ